jgi:hypothetical protein
MKKLLIFVAILVIFAPSPAFAVPESKQALISSSCGSLKVSIKRLQIADAAVRVHLGSTYDKLFKNYIMPMNTSLLRNNLLSHELSDLQSAFSIERANFTSHFVSYSRSLDDLLSVNCYENADLFYEKLELSREKRSDLEYSARKLDKIVDDYYKGLEKIGVSL